MLQLTWPWVVKITTGRRFMIKPTGGSWASTISGALCPGLSSQLLISCGGRQHAHNSIFHKHDYISATLQASASNSWPKKDRLAASMTSQQNNPIMDPVGHTT
eukprot:350499-Chlamydomonas_euryale.AAC.7